jgi:hypothetical protein
MRHVRHMRLMRLMRLMDTELRAARCDMMKPTHRPGPNPAAGATCG